MTVNPISQKPILTEKIDGKSNGYGYTGKSVKHLTKLDLTKP
ncbi:hypothetical protein [Tumidithrix elongata]